MLILPKKMCNGHVEEREFTHLFHTTRKKNVASILKEGLKRREGCAMIFLSTEAYSWRHQDERGDDEETLMVDIDGLDGKFTDFLPDLDEVNYWGDIPPERIKTVTEWTRERGL